MGIGAFAQDEQYIKPGVYKGVITESQKEIAYSIDFDTDGYVYQVSNVDGIRMTFNEKVTSSDGQITTLQWINSGGAWTETQIFIVTKISNSVMQVFHLRYVVNKGTETEFWYYGNKALFYLEY